MSKQATEFQKKEMSKMYRGKEIFKPLNTGWVDEHVACVREWVANIFFYRKGDATLMIDAGYNYDRLEEKMGWLGIDPGSIRHILITHQDTDHVGAVEADSPGLFRNATLYVGETENRYLTGEVRRKVIYHLYKLPQVTIPNEKVLLRDRQVFELDSIQVECFLVPGHTWGHMVVSDRRTSTFSPAIPCGSGRTAATASSRRWRRTTSLAVRSLAGAGSEADGTGAEAHYSSPAIPAGRTISTLRLPIRTSCARPLKSASMTPTPPTTPTTSRTTPRKRPAAVFCQVLAGKSEKENLNP